MKKLLTVLLTLVMAIGLVVLNNNHTKAEEGNQEYTFTFSDPTWDVSPSGNYQKLDKVNLVNNESIINVIVRINDIVKANFTGSTYEYTFKYNGSIALGNQEEVFITYPVNHAYTYSSDGAGGKSWDSSPILPSYTTGELIEIKSTDTGYLVDIYVNGSKVKDGLEKDLYDYTIVNTGATITLSTSGGRGIVNIVDKSAPSPTPTPSEPVFKDESCEKVIGPTWHWNNDKGICEEYATVGTSTR